jgi:cyclic pyranopterin phosphate synthase
MAEFSHVEGERASMVDVGDKPDVRRESVAVGEIELRPETIEAVSEEAAVKENVLPTARIAAIQAVKRTWDDIPMCHQIPITDVTVGFDLREEAIEARVTVASTGKTGVEMEALNGVSRALLTIWDMVKSVEKDDDGQYPETVMQGIRIERKLKDDPSAGHEEA